MAEPVQVYRAPSRSQAIRAAIAAVLAEHGAGIDRADDLGEVTLTVRLHAGTQTVRSVGYTEERVRRSVNRLTAPPEK